MTEITVVNTTEYKVVQVIDPDFYPTLARWLDCPVEDIQEFPQEVVDQRVWAIRHPTGEINYLSPTTFASDFEIVDSDEPEWKKFENKAAKDAETVRRLAIWVQTLHPAQQEAWKKFIDEGTQEEPVEISPTTFPNRWEVVKFNMGERDVLSYESSLADAQACAETLKTEMHGMDRLKIYDTKEMKYVD